MDFKSGQSKKNWDENKILYILLLVLIVYVVLWINSAKLKESKGFSEEHQRLKDGNGLIYAKGRGNDSDSIDDLLNRIEWSTYLERRMARYYRTILISLIATALVSFLAMRKLPKISTLIITFVVIFIPVYAAQQLYYVHGDIYNDYYIKDNVRRLRSKVGNNAYYEEPPCPIDNLPRRAQVMNPA